MKNTSLYDTDFYAWSQQQAALLRDGRFGDADIENIAEEIESMGRTEKRELVSRLRVLLMHLLKWRYQPLRQVPSWEVSIRTQRIDIEHHLEDNPSLKSHMDEALARAYRGARPDAALETGLPEGTFPSACPWSYAQIIDATFWPTE
jgi:Domain of unknown function DUF29